MELAAAVFSTISGAIGGAGATAAGATAMAAGDFVGAGVSAASAAAGGGGLFGGSFLASVLQGGVGAMSAMAAIREGDAKAAALQGQAADAELESGQQKLRGLQRTDELRRQLLEQQGEREVAWGASGVDSSFGTPAQARMEAADAANRAIDIEGSNAALMSDAYARRAAGYRRQAREARSGGLFKAIGAGLESAIGIARRG